MIRTRSRVALVAALGAAWWAGVTLTSQQATSRRTAAAMTTAATAFLQGLTPEQRQQATFPLDDAERVRWNFIPTNMFPRKGVPIKEMSEPQRKLAHELLKAAVGQRGYMTATSIMQLETILHALENSGGRVGKQVRDPELYFFTIFGTPSPKTPWGLRVEGHHVSLHFSINNNSAVANTPAFFGTNPAEVREEGPKKGQRLLGSMEDPARALVASLDDAQKKIALITDVAPNDIVTATNVKIDPLLPSGIPAADLKPAQIDLLMKTIQAYTAQMADDVAAERMAAIERQGRTKINFAWAGPTELGKQHYYRIQGPTFLIEYDNTQNQGNHVHSVWRDFAGDFGRDLLREHIKSVAH
ncbi:MAG TPA: DUF3500 domain-containing protein [Vicinamibacterales bacterium]|jgi:hypothetical protein